MVAEPGANRHNEKLPPTSKTKPSVRLVCWNRDLADERADSLSRAGFRVDAAPLKTSGLAGQFKDDPPAAIVIDLDRLPSHGMAVGLFLRRAKSTRHIPLLFAGGAAEKVERVREQLPDAGFASWDQAAKTLKPAIAKSPVAPVVPKNHDFYDKHSLAEKIGLKPKMLCALIAPPAAFEEGLDGLPEGFEFQPKLTKDTKLLIWWLRNRGELEHAAALLGDRLRDGANVWFVYPKKGGGIPADFNMYDVRAACLECGLVDFKICAFDKDWTGMKFGRKRK
jgi:hypothetical protein